MEQQFSIILTNRSKAALLGLGTVVVTTCLLLGVGIIFASSKLLGGLLAVPCLMVIVLLPERIAKHFSAEHATVDFDATGITVSYAASGEVHRLDFAEIVSYYRGFGFDFTIRRRSGKALVLHLNHKLNPDGMVLMMAFEQHFDWAVKRYNQAHFNSLADKDLGVASGAEHSIAVPIRRLGFVSQPAGTFWLVALAGLTGWSGWRVTQPNASEGAWGSFIFVGLCFVVYVLVWWNERQNQK